MNPQQAKKLIIKTFENSFNKEVFIEFLSNLLKKIDNNSFLYNGNYIHESFSNAISSLERVGKYTYDDKEIDLLIVKLKRETSIERARSLQRNLIAWYLNGSRGDKLKDAALVAFVSPNSEDWRFSLIKMDYRFDETSSGKIKVKEEFTPARRWSFLVGKNEKSHTAQSRFIPLLEDDSKKPTLEDLENAFNVEVVTREFFEKYRDLFVKTKIALDKVVAKASVLRKEFEGKGVNTVDFAKKLLGQIVFLYFLQKKGWFGVAKGDKWGSGPKDFMRRLFNKEYSHYKNFFNDILEPLFYEALRTDRSSDDHFYKYFNCKIPFLNGGLFDPINNYDWVNIDILLPDSLFSNKNKTKEGDIGDGILDVFDRYNFTVNEEEPLEKEVALDPELLGKIYEKLNAIRYDNFDEYYELLRSGKKGEENKFNKEYGVYYTPREIVHYMCQESLINYLETEMQGIIKKEDLKEFVKYADFILEHEKTALEKSEQIKNGVIKETKYEHRMPDTFIQNAEEIDKLLKNIKLCDPAVGSGAFPIGMLHEIVKLRQLLTVYRKVDINTYDLKRECIENSLYGVDIDNGAIETCKLRFWLSMIVDEEDFQTIKPLPNLDYKIVCGDSLLGYPYNPVGLEKIENLKSLYFAETNPRRKNEIKKDIDQKLSEIFKGTEKSLGIKIRFSFNINFSEVFHEKKGFDIVIANPPYVQLQKNSGKLANLYQKKGYDTFDRMGDIYCLFYEKGMEVLKNNGHLCFITSNKWMRAGYGEKLRSFFLKFNPKVLIDLGPGIFESATVDTSIVLVQKQKTSQIQLKGVTLTKNNSIDEQINKNVVVLEKLTKDAWFIGSSAEQRLKEKIERIGKPLKDWDVNIYYGIKTGLNEAFIITTEKRNEILSNCKTKEERKRTEAIIKPILRGRDIKRYYYEWAGLWVIGTFPALKLNIENYSSLKKYFLDNFDIRQLEQSGKKYPNLGFNARKKTGNKWFETQDQIAYYPEFEKEKVVWNRITNEVIYSFIDKKFFVLDSTFFITGTNLKYLIALLNSKIILVWMKHNLATLGEGMYGAKIYVEKIPLPPITTSNQPIVTQIETLVSHILTAKKPASASSAFNAQADTSHWEREIDQLVYRLYELTEEEIKIIENKS